VEPFLDTLTIELGLDPEIYRNPASFIATVRAEISGQILRRALEKLGGKQIFARALNTDATGLENYCRAIRLDRGKSEIVLDTIRVWIRIQQIWESGQLAESWIRSNVPALGGLRPLELFDTYEGRRWVIQVIEKIECGEFS
tara:strand:- start:1875 stop:2300 length:426 start_codon:yes stop_codon:yes gene_type:complete